MAIFDIFLIGLISALFLCIPISILIYQMWNLDRKVTATILEAMSKDITDIENAGKSINELDKGN